jgi:alpha-1,6-mannosyltransferase
VNTPTLSSSHFSSFSKYTFAATKFQLLFRSHLPIISLIGCGLASSLIYLKILGLGDLRNQIPQFLFYFLLLSPFYLVAGYIASRINNRRLLFTILLFAFLFRIILLFTAPTLSDDIYRYAWEGYLQTRGINPYLYAPSAPQLMPYRNEIWHFVNNKDVTAIYPPLSQLVNALVYLIFKSILGFKIAFMILDGMVIWGILNLLKLHSINRCNIIFYTWSPLVVVEIAGSGHSDVLVVGMILWSAVLCLSNRPLKSVPFLAGAILSKIYPLLMVPLFLRRIPYRHWLWLPPAVLLGYLPYLKASQGLFSALSYYKEKWRFNGFLFEVLSRTLSSEVAVERLVLVVMGVLITLSLTKLDDLLRQLYWLTGGLLLLVPTLFPWYVVWIIPFLCFFPNPAWMLFSFSSALSYYVLIDWWSLGIWRQNDLFLALEYYPFFGLLFFSVIKSLLSKRANRN